MIRLSRLADYAVLLAGKMASEPERTFRAADLAETTHLPAPTTSKVLALLAKQGIVVSQRGASGGYRLGRPADQIPVGAIIEAMDGPVALTVCVDGGSDCELMEICPCSSNWQRINDAIRATLDGISLSEMTLPPEPSPSRPPSVPQELRP